MSTASSLQSKTSALFSRATSAKIYANASAMNNNHVTQNNNNNNNNCATMATNTTSSASSGFAKGFSLFANIAGGNGAAGTQCSTSGSPTAASVQVNSAAQVLNHNNNNNNNNNNVSVFNNNHNSGVADSGGPPQPQRASDNVVLSGNLRKLKTMKKKYFVLYRNAPNRAARLEYFDSEKKYRLHANHPKRSILLEACFNINRRTDTKHKCVIALYTNEDCFCIVCDNEQELELWLHKMLSLQNNKDENGEPPKPAFAHVWTVDVQRRGLAQDKGLIGKYHLCLTDKSITLNRFGQATASNGEPRLASVEFPMSTVRKGGHLNCVFYMELGRQNVLGAGELWVEAQDAATAQAIHHSIINASSKPTRPRSQSASHASKPIILRRQTTQGTAQGTAQGIAPMNFSPSSGTTALSGMTGIPAGMAIKRERCDSLPSRNRTISDSGNASSLTSSSSTIMPPPKTIPTWNRPVSMCNRPSSSPISPSVGSESDGSSISIDEPDGLPAQYTTSSTPDDNGGFFHKYAGPQDSAILEEGDEYWNNDKFQKRVPGPSRPPQAGYSAASLSLPIAKGARVNGSGSSTGMDIAGSSSPAVHSSSAEGHTSNYMDMYSPSGSSPLDPTGNGTYMPMSPSVDVPRSLYTGSSSTHSRASSLTEENLDMGSRYVDMDLSHNLTSQHHRRGGGGALESGLSPAASSSSITSGTPSTDTRFADYPLEKVYSTFGPDDDENNPLCERPMRAYSVGSRLEHSKRKFRVDHSLSSSLASNSSASSRTRAYSVGSRASKMPRSDQYKSSYVGSPAQIALFNAVQHSQYQTGSMMMMPPCSDANNNNNNNNKMANTNNKKSSSVPMLDTMHAAPGAADVPLERVTDFMELDFSAISKINEAEDYVLSDNLTPVSQPSLEHDYLNMEPVGKSNKAALEGYVDMRPVGSSSGSTSVASSPARQGGGNTPKLSSSQKSSSLVVAHEGDYLDMRGKDASLSSPVIKKSALSGGGGGSSSNSYPNEDYLNMAPLNRDLSNGGQTPETPVAQPVSGNVMTSSAEEGYLEMSFSRSNSISTPSAAEFNAQQDLYMKTRKPMTTNRSLPININYNSIAASTVPAPGVAPITPRNSVGLFSKLSSLEEVHSPTTPGAGKKVATPTMFPFSPASPAGSGDAAAARGKFQPLGGGSPLSTIGGAIGVGEMVEARKILVDGSTGTIRLSEETPRRKGSEQEGMDYVNYEPQRRNSNRSNGTTAQEEENSGDYVLMNPVANTSGRRKSSGQQRGGFRPIQSSLDGEGEKEKAAEESPYELLRTTSAAGESASDLSALLVRGSGRRSVNSRPSSVNSDKITSRISNLSLNRPNSANSDRLSTISSSSSSTSTLCGNSSSSSSTTTLCGPAAVAKCHSPMNRVPSDPSSSSSSSAAAAMEDNTATLKCLPRINTASSVDKELHYASLDLPASTASSQVSLAPLAKPESDFAAHSGSLKGCRSPAESSASSSATTTPSPNVLCAGGGGAAGTTNGGPLVPAFNYAQLDFAKCEAMKQH